MKKWLHIGLALLLLSGNLGLTVGTHYCMGRPMESRIALGHTHLGCGMLPEDMPSDSSEEDFPCCEDQFEALAWDDNLPTGELEIASSPVADLEQATDVYSFSPHFLPWSSGPLDPPDPSPPPPIRDIHIRFQVFRI